MKNIIMSDGHGNKIYVETILREVDTLHADNIIFLGDAFGYMNDGLYIFRELEKRKAVILKGNHEAMLTGEIPIDDKKDELYGLKYQQQQLDSSLKSKIKSLPNNYILFFDNKSALFIHGSPRDYINGYLYEDNTEYQWGKEQYDYIFMGHTHRPYVKRCENTTYINVGSIGLPRDIGTMPCYVIFDDETGSVEVKRIKINESVLDGQYFAGIDDRIISVLRRK